MRTAEFIRRCFPERQILLKEERRVRCLTITTAHQLGLCGALAACFVWSITVTFGYVFRTAESDVKQQEIASRTAEVDDLKKNYQAAFGRLDEYESLFSGITCEISDIQDSLLRLSEKDVASEKHASMPRLDHDPAGCRSGSSSSSTTRSLFAANDDAAMEVASVSGIEPAVADAEKLRQRVSQLADGLDRLRASHNAFLQYSVSLTEQRIGKLEKTLSVIGMRGRGPFGQGGPFIAATPGKHNTGDNFDPIALFNAHADRYDNLNSQLHSLPLAAPLEDWEITSPFGSRNDPINTMTGVHEGVDLGASIGTPALATGNGTVVWAGWRDRYGLLVEIDHGSGLQSRYAHLSKVSVKVGDHVVRGDKVGLVGETGRTTGPHLHYEVRVDDQAVNPMRFISAGEHVLKNQ